MSWLTEQEEADLMLSGLSQSTPFCIRGVSNTQLSVARHFGACTYQGESYSYIPPTDELVRRDVVTWISKQRKAAEREAKREIIAKQESLI
jgi:hypothetical protein